jgi:hypothetical protein
MDKYRFQMIKRRHDQDTLRHSDNQWLIEQIEILTQFAKDVYDNWDCDTDAHKFRTPCRKCEARKLIKGE